MSLLQAWRAKLSAAASDALSDKKTSGRSEMLESATV